MPCSPPGLTVRRFRRCKAGEPGLSQRLKSSMPRTHTHPPGWYHHDKLAPAVVLVQLEHGLDVGVGLAHAGLHLDGEVVAIVPSLQLV